MRKGPHRATFQTQHSDVAVSIRRMYDIESLSQHTLLYSILPQACYLSHEIKKHPYV